MIPPIHFHRGVIGSAQSHSCFRRLSLLHPKVSGIHPHGPFPAIPRYGLLGKKSIRPAMFPARYKPVPALLLLSSDWQAVFESSAVREGDLSQKFVMCLLSILSISFLTRRCIFVFLERRREKVPRTVTLQFHFDRGKLNDAHSAAPDYKFLFRRV